MGNLAKKLIVGVTGSNRTLDMIFIYGFVALLIFCTCVTQAGIKTRNSSTPSGNGAAFAAWLDDIGITEDQIQYLVDFESGFAEGQNVSGLANLFPGGLVITDTSSSHAAKIRSSSSYFGGSVPVGTFAVAHNEKQFLELNFAELPVDYVSFQDIDHAGTTIYVDFVGGGSTSFSIETTSVSGNSAEFTGIFRNDMPAITRIRMDASGDAEWGIDNIRYGVVSPCTVSLISLADFASQWLHEGPGLDADLDHNEQVTIEDLIMLLELWLAPCPPDWPL